MKHTQILKVLAAIVALYSLPVFGASIEPLTVSPGATDRVTGVEVRCPTFSWQAVFGAVGYEVVVYELPPKTELAAWSLDEAVEVLFVELPSGVTAWTPSLERGLARGADHVWFVRGVFGDFGLDEVDATEWSVARFFRVAGGAVESETEVRSRGGSVTSGTGTVAATATATATDPAAATDRATAMTAPPKSRQTPVAAIRGDMTDPSGDAFGVLGTTASPDGGGVGAGNLAGGPDLILDGTADGEPDLDLYQWGLDRPSAGAERVNVTNSLGGGLTFDVDGEIRALSFNGDGTMLSSVDAETLDTYDSTDFSLIGHVHDGRYYTETELSTSGAGGSVHWDNVASLPAGFADGVDNDTTYTAGSGIDLVGTEIRAKGTGFANVVVVALSGGDFTSVQVAIDSIMDASASSPYLVWVAPGVYNEAVTMKSHVHLQGSGADATVITSTVTAGSFPPSTATVVLAANTSLRDIGIENTASSGTYATALLVPPGSDGVDVSAVSASSKMAGSSNFACHVGGVGTEATIADSLCIAEDGNSNHGLNVVDEASVILRDVTIEARRGTSSRGLVSNGPNTTVRAFNIEVLAEDSIGHIYAVDLGIATDMVMVGGTITASRGSDVRGIFIEDPGTRFEMIGVRVVAEDGTAQSTCLFNYDSATAILRGGACIGRRGGSANGIRNYGAGSVVETHNVLVYAHDADFNAALRNSESASTRLHGGSFVGRGGTYTYGINSTGAGSMLHTWGVEAVGEDGSYANHGMLLTWESASVLHGGSCTARGGTNSYGIYGSQAATTLEATGLTALGEGAIQVSTALYLLAGVTAEVRGGWFTGIGGATGSGVTIEDAETTFDATGIVVSGSGGASQNYGLHQQDGTSNLAVSQFVNGIARIAGTMNCFRNYDGSYALYACP